MKRLAPALILFALACSDIPMSPSKSQAERGFLEVTVGMPYTQVIDLMGEPTETQTFTSSLGTSKTCLWYEWDADSYDWDYYYSITFERERVTYLYSG